MAYIFIKLRRKRVLGEQTLIFGGCLMFNRMNGLKSVFYIFKLSHAK